MKRVSHNHNKTILVTIVPFLVLMFLSFTQIEYGHSNSLTNQQLVSICGAKGLGVDFATGSCVSSGKRTSPNNISPSTSPRQSSQELIMSCGGKGVDFVTGKCN